MFRNYWRMLGFVVISGQSTKKKDMLPKLASMGKMV